MRDNDDVTDQVSHPRHDDDATPSRTRAGRPWWRRRLVWVVAATVVAFAVFVLVWFQPQKLIVDDHVDEALPTGEAVELARGEFISREHGTTGVARVLQLADGRRIVRLENLDTSNGPALYVYLSRNPADGDESAFDDGALSLGALKGNIGDQNYVVPTDADLGALQTVVIWCDRFDAAFGAADLTAAAP
jgi:hypothetical protein